MAVDAELMTVEAADLVVRRPPDKVLAEAHVAAKALKDVLDKKEDPVIINGKQYLEFEDWQTLGRFYSVTAKTESTAYVEFDQAVGFSARAVALRADGVEISAAESMCLNDEDRWRGRPMFQLKSMAQTRACAKALRNVLAWVVVLAGYGATPAEELDGTERDSGRRSPQRQAPSADGTTTVKLVHPRDGKKPWKIDFADGRSGGTFDDKLAADAERAAQNGARVRPTLNKKDKFTDLVALDVVEAPKPEQPPPDMESPVVERILTMRKAAGAAGEAGWMVIQGSEREYVSNVPLLVDTANDLRVSKGGAIVSYAWKRAGTSGWRREITGFADAPTDDGPRAEQPDDSK